MVLVCLKKKGMLFFTIEDQVTTTEENNHPLLKQPL